MFEFLLFIGGAVLAVNDASFTAALAKAHVHYMAKSQWTPLLIIEVFQPHPLLTGAYNQAHSHEISTDNGL